MGRRNKRSRKERREARRRGAYVLPNLFTTASLFSGFFAATEAIQGNFIIAALAILASLVLDGLDGKVARATGTTSQFGVEYDSLCDLVAFGVAPAVLLYMWSLQSLDRLGFAAGFLFVACGALRLARFNVQTEKVGTSHFVGLPIPAAASVVSTLVLMWHELLPGQPPSPWLLVALVFVLSFLMVSSVPYLSFKELGLSKLRSFNWMVATVLLFILVAIQPQVMGFAIMAAYLLGGPFAARYLAKKKAAKLEAEKAASQTAVHERLPLS
ncbi:MAG: CDP-diacylglycerol--serine O-phosphatidyltransferase [Desulfarculaceae bacterium]|nr:CDP-diacylglycerol--serine O-phosphatidyltransferase [Desulfarculaceae bacterium]MCF8071001.1 CDP-diacylglycerol--serine O-phosphatidyltransferase [Desulfarculaceae bacterium]MCF8100589.1 CDP-diacylglycerol--serine O-phosphatidyltransferase [Desulfarculaceae bacterium]MCF8117721.1 CDP-diacylglycerol--serine O-phosphatidyltransferase [Desulfarculaceae bacterium]